MFSNMGPRKAINVVILYLSPLPIQEEKIFNWLEKRVWVKQLLNVNV